jgi:hypothetical protein
MDKAVRYAQQLAALEREYVSVLKGALTACAHGQWGLFGHNELPARYTPAALDELRGLAEAIDRLRERNRDFPFVLHQEFEAARGRVGPNDPGEPKVAQAWLKRFSDLGA